MAHYSVLYNPLSGNGHGKECAETLKEILPTDTFEFTDITSINDYSAFLGGVENLLICGGDGTLNRFVNNTHSLKLPEHIFYFPTGTGNDFANEISLKSGICDISQYLKDLPTVTVNGKTTFFINGIGYGIDGYCCEVGDKLRAKSDKPVNYALIAIKGLLFYFKPRNAVITVDGKTESYKKVWLAPTMNGKMYGGGMIPTPSQDRTDNKLSLLVWYGSGKIPTLAAFPSIFKGEHIKHTRMCKIITGHNIKVEFSSPCALQIDGETVLNVSSYEATKNI